MGGLAQHKSANQEAFLYTLFDSDGECGIRHSYRISRIDLGIQAVSISETKVWSIALSTGVPSLGIADTTNVVIRMSKEDATEEPEFYRVDFRGSGAGIDAT